MREIPLSKGAVAIVDDEDYVRVSSLSWHLTTHGYAYAREKGRREDPRKLWSMHRFVLDAPPAAHVDHINGDRLDNRRANLRLATQSQNNCNAQIRSDNRSGYKGVGMVKHLGKWRARVKAGDKEKHIGVFECVHCAAIAYNETAKVIYGEYARLNDIPTNHICSSGHRAA